MYRYTLLILILCLLTSCEEAHRDTFHINGKIKSTVPLVNDKKHGIEKTFYPSGALQSEISFKEGIKDGPAIEYFEDGSVQANYTYQANFIEGELTRYYPNGKLAFQAKYAKNIPSEFPKFYDEKGEPQIKGTYIDPRDKNEYEWVRLNNFVWTAQNMNYSTEEGSLCMQCNHWGRLYDFEAAQKACLKGFHIPSEAEWKSLLTWVGVKPGQKLKAKFGWDPIGETGVFGNGTDTLGFAVKSGGAHFAPANTKEKKFDQAGKKAYLWTKEGSVVVFFYENDNVQIQKWDPKHGASLRCIKDTP